MVQFALVIGPAVFADQRHEAHVAEIVLLVSVRRGAPDPDELLVVLLADRHDQAAADGELFAQRLRHVRSSRGADDGVEWRGLRPAQSTVADTHLDVVVAQFLEALLRYFGKLGM